ncbi:MAG: wax ester/triacylglycerol synthase domain-containing protein [Gordonia sp. (in: high G+C Gram-positive bacteria)]|uniref:wax ester/triacylglycerol synthase domain-containing protein n=1 Tax=Gordonia sp. (in: high G+C Gram-positive bacteria) TaxID=84139 RepID=UPI003BB636A4
MVNRLSPDDAMYYFLDRSGTTTHLGALVILDPAAADPGCTVDYASLVALVENRLTLVPRYRQRVAEVTFGLARPLWVDDPDFDITFHVRRAALPQPGDDAALADFIARVMSRPLDRNRPLWEMYLVEGLVDGRSAILTKTHRCLLGDGAHREISEVIAEESIEPVRLDEELWMPATPPGARSRAIGALAEVVARPGELVDAVFNGAGPLTDLLSLADRSARFVGNTAQQLMNSAPDSPLNRAGSSARLYTFVSVPREQVQAIAERFECSFNDVILGVITGVMRRWTLSVKDLLSHGETVRAVLPLGARESVADETASGGWMNEGRTEFITDLPIGEDAPSVRLMQVAGLADRYSQSQGRMTLGLRPMLPELGVVPFADVTTRVFNSLFQRSYNVPIRIGNSRIERRYVNGVPVTGLFTVPMLAEHRALAISVNEYHEAVEFGFLADRNALGDLPAMAGYVTESIEELATGGFPNVFGRGGNMAGPKPGAPAGNGKGD